jgi:hypothetical protein
LDICVRSSWLYHPVCVLGVGSNRLPLVRRRGMPRSSDIANATTGRPVELAAACAEPFTTDMK